MSAELRIELACCTSVLLNEISLRELKQKDVALTYAMAMRSSESTDWTKVNEAIIERWSQAGLQRIKTMAWKRIESKS